MGGGTTSPIWILANYYGLAYAIFSCLLTRLWQEFWVPQLWCNYYYQDTALKIRDSLEVDNYKFVETKLENDTLVTVIESESIMSLLHTTEDYLSCLTTAESVISQTLEKLEK